MLNPNAKIAKSKGIDLPIMKVYLAGRIAGNCIDKCLEWRKQIINHYRNYKAIPQHDFDENNIKYESYPISFLCPLNSGESKTADEQGLKSHIPANLIYQKDMLSIKHADVIIANMDDFMEEGISEEIEKLSCGDITDKKFIEYLLNKIKNRRENFGTIEEVAIAKYLGKPTILIVPPHRAYLFREHPFQKRADVIVTSVDQLLKEKWLQILYKSMAGSTGEY